jgi:catechol 2,3-dioxygenase-like lactoylglutathione lyase family enzyme
VPAALNHTIVHCRDGATSSTFLTEVLGIDAPKEWGPFHVVELGNGVSLDYMTTGPEYDFLSGHYAFLVTEAEFDEIFGRIQERRLDYFADPHGNEPGEINHHDGGRGVYWDDPDGHRLEILTVPHGGG